jgi:septal ring factor EnvC (AmiA/AmiB activator)
LTRFFLFNRDSVLATISRSLRDKLSLNQAALAQENENLEEDMRKAQESTLMLKSVIIPLEAEINQLKTQLKEAKDKINELEALVSSFSPELFQRKY